MVGLGWCRRYVNHQVGRIKRMLRWATENELVSPHVFHAVQLVAGLRMGRSPARDHPPVKPVADAVVGATLPHLSSVVAPMVRLQLLTGMRPGEVVAMRTGDVDCTDSPWAYRPARHKTEQHGHDRVIYLGPQAQALVAPFLRPGEPGGLGNPGRFSSTT